MSQPIKIGPLLTDLHRQIKEAPGQFLTGRGISRGILAVYAPKPCRAAHSVTNNPNNSYDIWDLV